MLSYYIHQGYLVCSNFQNIFISFFPDWCKNSTTWDPVKAAAKEDSVQEYYGEYCGSSSCGF
jgi:hypothetical protein